MLAVVLWSWVANCVHCVKFESISNFHTVQLHKTTANITSAEQPYAVVHSLVLLTMGIMMPETY